MKKPGTIPKSFQLQTYDNPESGIVGFEINEDYIIIRFEKHPNNPKEIYLYNYWRPGKKHIDAMKQLALTHKGLNTYKNQKLEQNEYAAYWDENKKKFIVVE